MKPFYSLIFLLTTIITSSQTFENLEKLDVAQKIYFSSGAKDRASKIGNNVAGAEEYFIKELKVKPDYTLLVLSESDWKKFAHPNAIYGIPHFLPDGRLIVAAHNNEFWNRNLPPLDKLPKEVADQVRAAYTDETGTVSLKAFFDLLAIHELGHAFQKASGMVNQRHWTSELLCNLLLHAYVAEKDPGLLPALTLFPEMTVNFMNPANFQFTSLRDFETHYDEIAQKHPDNYGWYQCRFHSAAAQIYNTAGVDAMKSFWNGLLTQKQRLDDPAFALFLSKEVHPALNEMVVNWDRK